MHCSTGHSPAKLMFGRNLRSRLDLILPKNKTKIANKHEKGTAKRNFKIGDRVRVRWYSARKEYWRLGLIDGIIGNRMFKILMDGDGITCIRHIDQLLHYKSYKCDDSEHSQNELTQDVPPTPNHVSFASPPPALSAVQVFDNNASSENSVTTLEGEAGDTLPVRAAEIVARSDECTLDHGAERVDARLGSPAVVTCATTAGPETAAAQVTPPPTVYARSQRPRNKVDYSKFYK